MKITTLELIQFMNLFHKNNDEIYKSMERGFNTIAYLSSNFSGILFVVNDDKNFSSEAYEISDEEICRIFRNFTSKKSFELSDELKEYIEFSDARGFVSDGFYIFKGVEDFKWNRYTAKKDLIDFNAAILKAGAKYQNINNNFVDFGFTANFNGEILEKLTNGGFVGRILHRGVNRFVTFNSDGKCFDIYPNNPDLIQWGKYDLKKIKHLKVQ